MTLTPTRFLACLALATVPAFAAPSVTYTSTQGHHEATDLEWELHYVEVSGVERSIQERVNAQLLRVVQAQKARTIALLTDDPELGQREGWPHSNTLTVGTGVGVVTDDLLSVSLSVSTYFRAMMNPDMQMHAVTFDLKTGQEIDPDAFFPGGKDQLIQPVSRKLQEEYHEFADLFENRPRVSDIRNVVVEPEGMSFLWGFGGLDAPRVVGPIMASLTWAELGDSVDRELLRSAILLDPALPNMSFGEDPTDGEGDPDAPVTLDNPGELYLMAIEDRMQGVGASLTVQERLSLLMDSSWKETKDSEELLKTLEAAGLADLAGRIRAMRERARGFYAPEDYAGLEVVEGGFVTAGLEIMLSSSVSGRVMTSGGNLLVRELDPEDDDAWGKPIARIPHDTVVAVMRPANLGLFHVVMLSDGRVGKVHKNYLLLETPVIDGRGRVLEIHDELVFGGEAGPQLLPKDGPGHTDAKLEQLAALVVGDESPPVNLVGIQREIGFRPAWLTVIDFTDLSGVPQGGEGQPLEGLTDKLPAK